MDASFWSIILSALQIKSKKKSPVNSNHDQKIRGILAELHNSQTTCKFVSARAHSDTTRLPRRAQLKIEYATFRISGHVQFGERV